MNILTLLLLIPVLFGFIVAVLPSDWRNSFKYITLAATLVQLGLSIYLYCHFKTGAGYGGINHAGQFQFVQKLYRTRHITRLLKPVTIHLRTVALWRLADVYGTSTTMIRYCVWPWYLWCGTSITGTEVQHVYNGQERESMPEQHNLNMTSFTELLTVIAADNLEPQLIQVTCLSYVYISDVYVCRIWVMYMYADTCISFRNSHFSRQPYVSGTAR